MTENKKAGSSGMPAWIGNYPNSSSKKVPVIVKKGEEKALIYGRGNHLDSTPVFISTDKVGFFGEYTVPSGEFFDPPDIHAGDECYYCLEGIAHVFDPVHGEVVVLKQGDALLIPKGTWHIGFNFGDKPFRLMALVAPSIWSDSEGGMGLDVNFKGKKSFYKGDK